MKKKKYEEIVKFTERLIVCEENAKKETIEYCAGYNDCLEELRQILKLKPTEI